jgi:hypothetical protein
MKSIAQILSRWGRRLLPGALPLVLLGAGLVAGCVTQEQVASIVAKSNSAMLTGQLGGLAQKDDPNSHPAWEESNAAIESFIQGHPDQKEIIASLRVRQAMLLLANHQFNLAKAAFNSVPAGALHTDRDIYLNANSDSLLWWFRQSTADTWSPDDQAKARKALADLKTAQLALEGSPEIRDYFAEMRAYIGLAAAKQTTSEAQARELLVDALDVYAKIFSANDLSALRAPPASLPDASTLTADLHRRIRAAAVLERARMQNQDDSLHAHPNNATFDQMINP